MMRIWFVIDTKGAVRGALRGARSLERRRPHGPCTMGGATSGAVLGTPVPAYCPRFPVQNDLCYGRAFRRFSGVILIRTHTRVARGRRREPGGHGCLRGVLLALRARYSRLSLAA